MNYVLKSITIKFNIQDINGTYIYAAKKVKVKT